MVRTSETAPRRWDPDPLLIALWVVGGAYAAGVVGLFAVGEWLNAVAAVFALLPLALGLAFVVPLVWHLCRRIVLRFRGVPMEATLDENSGYPRSFRYTDTTGVDRTMRADHSVRRVPGQPERVRLIHDPRRASDPLPVLTPWGVVRRALTVLLWMPGVLISLLLGPYQIVYGLFLRGD